VIDVVLPVLNEREAIGWVLERLPVGYHAIVVDNGSDDGSGELAHDLGATVVTEPVRGFGSACWAGLNEATADVVAFMDCDRSLDPADLPSVCDPVVADRSDLVLAARLAERGAWPFHARVANRFLASRVNRRFDWNMTDLGPMRAARREALLELGLTDRRSGWPLEMVLKAGTAGWRVQEVALPYRPRVGRSKVTGTLKGTMQAISDMQAHLRT